MTGLTVSDVMPLLIALVAIVGMVVGLLTYSSNQARALRDTITKGDDASDTQAKLLVERESKSRHDAVNTLNGLISRLELEQGRLAREAFRKEDAKDMEQRHTASMSKVDIRLDGITERLSKLPVIEQQLIALGRNMDKLIERQEARSSHAA